MTRRASLLLALACAACTVGPDFHPPTPPDLPRFNDAGAKAPIQLDTNPDPRWWDGFHDPVLTELITRAIRNNLDVQQAVLRVVESRQGIVTARSAGLPMLNGTASYQREQLGLRGILASRGVNLQLDELSNQISSADPSLGGAQSATNGALNTLYQPIDLFNYGLSASWELDLFGRVRRNVEQARAQTQAQTEAANDALVSLESEVAQAYVQLRGAQALSAAQEENVRTVQASVDLTSRRQRRGLGTALDVDQAQTQLLDIQRQLPNYERQRAQAVNRLNVLVGAVPGTLDAQLQQTAPIPALPSVVGVGLPSTLARRRPDIRQAEAQFHAATANVGVAVASLYPDISLTGSLGIRATDVNYITNWASHYYSAGPSISLPIFQGGRLTANLRLARAQQVEAALHYRATVLNALREVEDSLVAYRADKDAREQTAATVTSASDTLYLANNRFQHGLSDFLQVLDAQRTLVTARQALVQADMGLANDIVDLYRALGGGWQDTVTASDAPPVPPTLPPVPGALDGVADIPGPVPATEPLKPGE